MKTNLLLLCPMALLLPFANPAYGKPIHVTNGKYASSHIDIIKDNASKVIEGDPETIVKQKRKQAGEGGPAALQGHLQDGKNASTWVRIEGEVKL